MRRFSLPYRSTHSSPVTSPLLPRARCRRPCSPNAAAVLRITPATPYSTAAGAALPASRWRVSSPGRSAERLRSYSASSAPMPSTPPSTNAPPNPNPNPNPRPRKRIRTATHDLTAPPYFPFKFETGIGLFAKRTPRPFPPPFLSPPSGSFSDPLSTHHRSRDRRDGFGGGGGASPAGGGTSGGERLATGELIRGWTNGDDAVFASEVLICAGDGVGAWSTRPRGHSGLWARLMLHFWAAAAAEDMAHFSSSPGAGGGGGGGGEEGYKPDPVSYLQRAFERTQEATSPPNDWQGTTTAAGAQLHYRAADGATPTSVLYVASLGDSQVMVVRPRTGELVYKTKEQWHWFDCPRQLGTNSPDTPRADAVVDVVDVEVGDVVLAMSDGVIDNLWPHEIVDRVCDSVRRWEVGEGEAVERFRRRFEEEVEVVEAERVGMEGIGGGDSDSGGRTGGLVERDRTGGMNGGMELVAHELMEAARTIAVDPFAESPFMERAIDEGLASEGGKLDDISVVAGLCRRVDR